MFKIENHLFTDKALIESTLSKRYVWEENYGFFQEPFMFLRIQLLLLFDNKIPFPSYSIVLSYGHPYIGKQERKENNTIHCTPSHVR